MMSVRRTAWAIGAPVRLVLVTGIRAYRLVLSGWLGGQCRFSPTCSRYAEEAIRTHGALVGSWLAVVRISRCHPFGGGGFDPVPQRGAYDVDIQTTHGRPHAR